MKIEHGALFTVTTGNASFPSVGLFTRRPTVEAAAGTVAVAPSSRAHGWGVGYGRMAPVEFATPMADIYGRDAAMSVPAISRARDLICSAVGGLPLTLWTVTYDATGADVERRSPPPTWFPRPDPNRTRQWLLSWTADDLLFTGRAYWKVTGRYADTFPSSFALMPAADVAVDAEGRVRHLGNVVPANDVVEFLGPTDGLLYASARTIQTALNLEAAAERFSLAEVPAGWLEQSENSEPLASTELAEMAADWTRARLTRTTAALNPYVRYRESSMDPSRLQLVEARLHQRGDCANAANIPAYFVSAPAGTGMTYLNATQAKQDLIDFGAMPYVQTIEQTLSGPNVTPRGQLVRLDATAWLRNPYTPGTPDQSPADRDSPPGRPRDVDGLNEGTVTPDA